MRYPQTAISEVANFINGFPFKPSIYGIEERYKGKLIDGDGKAWLIEVLDKWKWQDESSGVKGCCPNDYLQKLKRHTEKSPFTGSNFLKNAFLDGCDRAGLFSIKNDGLEIKNQK